jgi:ubiquinol oxidase
MYLLSPRTCHRIVGYFEEQAIVSYTDYLNEIENGNIDNIPAPKIAIDYWNLSEFARLKDVIIAVRDDEMGHRDVNHDYVKQIDDKKKIKNIKEDSLGIKEKSN